ncbi:hypothetical protein [Zavarzinella formosa]|uniref:hypothetical protein n=1 Tax=Zavarzinella formosa TaxID=360055 RepID=UPI0012FC3B76|nr:hypothetical protein [Zavarzinella formosa]
MKSVTDAERAIHQPSDNEEDFTLDGRIGRQNPQEESRQRVVVITRLNHGLAFWAIFNWSKSLRICPKSSGDPSVLPGVLKNSVQLAHWF